MEIKLKNKLTTQKLDYLGQKDLFFDRELSWLSFNERVLKTAFDLTIPKKGKEKKQI
jgi:polyphosphate kinase